MEVCCLQICFLHDEARFEQQVGYTEIVLYAAAESNKNVTDDATIGKKRNFFGTNARIKPLGAIEEAAPQAVEVASGRALQPVEAASHGELQAEAAWSNLPDMVVAMIMTRVKADYLSQTGKKEVGNSTSPG